MILGLWRLLVFVITGHNSTSYFRWIANFLNDLVNFLDSQFNNAFVHPSRLLQFLDEHFLNVRDNLITKILRLF